MQAVALKFKSWPWILLFLLLFFTAGAAAQVDVGEVPAPHTPFELPFEATDVVFDAQRGMLYASSKQNKLVYFVNLETGLVEKQFSFEWMPEHMTLTPDGSRLFVALLTREHSANWHDGHEGYIASFDLERQVKDRQFWISEDPFGLAAKSNGHLIVSSGSGTSTFIRVFDGETGEHLGSSNIPYDRTRLALYPDETIVYATITTVRSYTPVMRYDVDEAGNITNRWGVWHQYRPTNGNFWVSPLGDVMIINSGDIFTAAGETQDTDIIYLQDLTPSYIDALAFDVARNVILTATDTKITYHNLESFWSIVDQPVERAVDFLEIYGLNIYTVSVEAGFTYLEVYEHLVPNGGTNAPPVAALEVTTPPSDLNRLTDIEFDASASTDTEGGLVYRWDFNEDGLWDTDFLVSPIHRYRFDIAGTKQVRLQVKDNMGALDDFTLTLNVAYEPEPGSPVQPSFILPFAATHAVFDPSRPYLYLSSKERKAVYFVNLETGFIEQQFNFAWMPEHMTITPDGSRLFVALLTRAHSEHWKDEEGHEGYIASFDLERQVKDRQFWISEDPFGLVAKSNDHLVVSSDSGRGTYIRVFDGETGEHLGSSNIHYDKTRLVLSPDEAAVYAIPNTVSSYTPVMRYNVDEAGNITRRWTKQLNRPTNGSFWVSPLGDVMIIDSGNIFTVTGMNYLQALTPSNIDALAFDVARNVILTATDTKITYYNLENFWSIVDQPVERAVDFLGIYGLNIYTAALEGGFTYLEVYEHLVPKGGTNAPPVAAFEVTTPSSSQTILTDIEFDASASTDAEGGLVYRWDFNEDGVWDTDFLVSPIHRYRFDIAGTKQIRLQVKDNMGALDDFTLTVNVAYEPEPGSPEQPSFVLPFAATHAVFDPSRPYLYVSSKERKAVYFVNLETGFTEQQFSFDWMPEKMTLTPDGPRLFVALPTQGHSEGYIASFDLDRQVKDRHFRIPANPSGLLAKSNDQLIVSSGLGDERRIRVLDGETGAPLGSAHYYPNSRFSLHPDETIVYTDNHDNYRTVIARYDIDDAGNITHPWNSVYDDDHRIGWNVWVSPLGDVLITGGGDIFTVGGDTWQTDMIYLRGLTPGTIDELAYDVIQKVILTAHDNKIVYYNLESFEWIAEQSVARDIGFLGSNGLNIYTLSVEAGLSYLEVSEHLVPDGGTNTPPVAVFEVTPPTNLTTLTDIEFDASASTDAEGGLTYRWDLDGDGAWDTDFLTSPNHNHRFDIAGAKQTRLQVKDNMGAVDDFTVTLNITFEPDPGLPGAAHPSFVLPFAATDAVIDPHRPFAYVSNKERKHVYFVNLQTSLIEKQFNFKQMPAHMTITPDGSRLFVALLTREHGPYSSDEDCCEGYIASFDLERQVKDRQFWISENPFGLLAKSNGQLVVSSGSGSGTWAYIRVFDGETGTLLGSSRTREDRTRLTLHPKETIIYAANDDHIERHDVDETGNITKRWEISDQGRHELPGNAWASPLGDVLIDRYGEVYTAGRESHHTDMIYLRGFTPDNFETLVYDTYRKVIITGRDGELRYYHLYSFEEIGTDSLPGDISFVGVHDLDVLALQIEGGETKITRVDHPHPNGNTDLPPEVVLDILPETEYTTQTEITFDASRSRDAEGAVLYRWDLDGDGIWDSGFSQVAAHVHRFDTAGTKFIALQVKDNVGMISEANLTIDVAFAPDPGSEPGQPHPGFVLQFPVTDAVFDPILPYAYVSSKERKRVYFVNLDTGFVEQQFSFDWMPEHMAITPDGSRLFVGLTLGHSPYWHDREDPHIGYIASFDLQNQVKDRQFQISADPYGLVVKNSGHLVVTSGSGQWSYIRVFDGETGELLGSGDEYLPERSFLSLHPSESIVYSADNNESYPPFPYILRYDVDDAGSIAYRWDSYNAGDRLISGNLWVSPLGDVLITRGGDIFTAGGETEETDMIFLRRLASSNIEALLYDTQHNLIFTGHDYQLRYYDLHSFDHIGATSIAGKIRKLGVRDHHVYALLAETDQARIVKIDHPVPDGDTDPINFLTADMMSYSNQDMPETRLEIEDGGATYFMEGNRWRQTSTIALDVTPDTVLEFDFMSDAQGEVHAIGFDDDNGHRNNPTRRYFQFWGTQDWSSRAIPIERYETPGSYQSYRIPVGDYFTGTGMHLVLISDNDVTAPTNRSWFRNVRIYESVRSCTVLEDFEGGIEGWTNSSESSCRTGAFVRGTPTEQRTGGGFVTQVGGDHSMSEDGNALFTAINTNLRTDDVDAGICILESPTWRVSEPKTLSLWYFHGQRDANDDPNRDDFFALEVSTDGGASYKPLVSIGDTRTAAAWTNAKTSIGAGTDVKLRIRVSDGPGGTGAGDIIEAGLDDVMLCPAN